MIENQKKYITYVQQCIVIENTQYILDYLKIEFLIREPALVHAIIVS